MFPRRHPILFSLLVVIAFLGLLLGPDFLFNGKSYYFIEGYGAVQRLVIGFLALFAISRLGWTDSAGIRRLGNARAWLIVIPPLVYLGAIYPYMFTGSWAPNLHEPKLTALVGIDAFAEGALEELIFRALIFWAFVEAWGPGRAAIVKAGFVSSIFFALPHLTNMLFGQQPLRVIAQVGWAYILGVAIAWLYYTGRSIWPAAFLHGGLDAVVAMNRMGMKIVLTPAKGLIMAAIAIPVLVYAWLVLRNAKPLVRPVGFEPTTFSSGG